MSAYKVLYRKYRPRFFADVIGQTDITETLKNELINGRVAHAYLFTGSHGTGKTTCAKVLSRAVNCLDPQNGDPCGECEICRGLEEGSILDVVEIDAASNNGIDHIRSLIEETNFTPATAKYRVYIIDEVHMLSTQAFNALLKTLEEPPAHVIFILATTEVHKLLPTILSRCQRFDFNRIPPEAIAERLEEVAKKENAELDHAAAMLIARISDGAMRDALSLLDQCLGRAEHITVDIVNQTAGMAARDYLSYFTQAIIDKNTAGALDTLDALHKSSKDMARLCEEMSDYFRSLMLIKTMPNASSLIIASEKEMNTMTAQALSMSLSAVVHGLDVFEETLNKMRYASRRTQLEMAFVKLCTPELDATPEAILDRLEALERGAVRTAVAVKTESVPVEALSAEPMPMESAPTPPPVLQEEEPEESEKAIESEVDEPIAEESEKAPEEAEEEKEPEEHEPTPEELGQISFDMGFAAASPAPVEPKLEKAPEAETEPRLEKNPEPAPEAQREAPPEPKLVPQPVEPIKEKTEAKPAKAKTQSAKTEVDVAELSAGAERYRDWSEILQVIKGSTKSVAMAFAGSTAYINGDYMLIDASEMAFDILRSSPDQRRRLREAIRLVTGKAYNIGPYRRAKTGDKQTDPIEELERRASDMGIAITEETEESTDGSSEE